MLLPEIVSRKDVPVPIWMFGGEQEAWAAAEQTNGGQRDRQQPAHLAWHQPYDARGAGRFLDRLEVHGRWNDLTYRRRGDGAPMVNFTWVDFICRMPTMTEMKFPYLRESSSPKFSRVDGETKYNPGV